MIMYYTPVLNVNQVFKKALFSLVSSREADTLGHTNFRNMLQLKPNERYATIRLYADVYCAFNAEIQERPTGFKTGFMIFDNEGNDVLPIFGRVVFVRLLDGVYVRMSERDTFNFMEQLKTEPSTMFSDSEWVSDRVYLVEKEGVFA